MKAETKMHDVLTRDRTFYQLSLLGLVLVVFMLVLGFGQLAAAMLRLADIGMVLEAHSDLPVRQLPEISGRMLWGSVVAMAISVTLFTVLFAFPPVVLGHALQRIFGLRPQRLWGAYEKVEDTQEMLAYVQEAAPGLAVDHVFKAVRRDANTAVRGTSLLLSITDFAALETARMRKPLEGLLSRHANADEQQLNFALHHEHYHIATGEAWAYRLVAALIFACGALAAIGASLAVMRSVPTANALFLAPLFAGSVIVVSFILLRSMRQLEVFAEMRADLYAMMRMGRYFRPTERSENTRDQLLSRRYPTTAEWQAYAASSGRQGTLRSFDAWAALTICAAIAHVMQVPVPKVMLPQGPEIWFGLAALLLLVVAALAGRHIGDHLGRASARPRMAHIAVILLPFALILVLRPASTLPVPDLLWAILLGGLAFGPALRIAWKVEPNVESLPISGERPANLRNDETNIPRWKRALELLHDVCRYGAAAIGVLFAFSAVLMTLDADVNDVQWDLAGSLAWLFLVGCLFLTWAFRASYWALLGELVTAVAIAFCVAIVIGGGLVWLELKGMSLDDAAQAVQVGQAMRYEAREFMALASSDGEILRRVLGHSWTILAPLLSVIVFVDISRALAIRCIRSRFT